MISRRLVGQAPEASALLSLMGNEKRFLILCHLIHEEMSVGAIAEKVGLSQSALSQHLAKLRGMRLVETRRDKQTIFYSLASSRVRMILVALDDILSESRDVASNDRRYSVGS